MGRHDRAQRDDPRQGQATACKEKKVEIEYTRHGPVVARKDGKAYVFRIPYFDEVGLADQTYKMVTAHNLAEMKKALSMLQLMMQNMMIGTVDGDIYYVRNGRVPIRPAGFDYKRAMPGNTSKAEWQGIHKFEDLVQIQNPPQGYMQNCNVSPQFLMKDCPLKPVARRGPTCSTASTSFDKLDQAYDNPLHQRAAMCVDLLHDTKKMTVEDAIEIALSPAVYGADAWQAAAAQGLERRQRRRARRTRTLAALYELIVNWNRRCDADGDRRRGLQVLEGSLRRGRRKGRPRRLAAAGGDHRRACCWPNWTRPPASSRPTSAASTCAYGDVYRVGRKGSKETWPVSGGSVANIATPRAISFEPIDGTKTFLGHGGQTSTQIVLLTKPPKSWTLLAAGRKRSRRQPALRRPVPNSCSARAR